MILVGLLTFVFCLVLTFVRYIELYYTFGLLDCVCYTKVHYIEVLSHTIYCNFGWAEEYRSLCRGLRYEEVRLIEVPLYR